ncbi:MAG: hypothetical protein AAB449_00420 [Patescibacteria group bacterium]
MKYFLVIGYALFLDGLQAGISFALAGFMGTIGGSVGGVIACKNLLPSVLQFDWVTAACAAGGGFIGTAANPALIPVGIAIGFVVNICLSLTVGSGLILLLVSVCGWKSVQKYLMPGFIGDTIPGINNLPFWTFLAIASCWQHASQKGELGVVGKAVGIATAPTRGIMSLKEKTMDVPRVKKTFAVAGIQQTRVQQPQTREELVNTAMDTMPRPRKIVRDILPKTT